MRRAVVVLVVVEALMLGLIAALLLGGAAGASESPSCVESASPDPHLGSAIYCQQTP